MKAKKSYKKGGKFPDLTGDGKVTRADVLKGRGVFNKGGKVIKRAGKNDVNYDMSWHTETRLGMKDKADKKGDMPGSKKDSTSTKGVVIPSGGKYNKGGKVKSRVNEAGNYTKPGMRKRLFDRIMAGTKGGKAGQWSARKAQLLASEYKKAGGGYKN